MAGHGILVGLAGCLIGVLLNGQARGELSRDHFWDVRAAPSPDKWSWFRHAPPNERALIWGQTNRAGFRFLDWAWQWRIGWVQVCATDPLPACPGILWEGLVDKALLVRSEAATAIGERFAGTANSEAIRHLSVAFALKSNFRHDQPLIAYRTVLFALHRIGGKNSLAEGLRLAERHVEAKAYWKKLVSGAKRG